MQSIERLNFSALPLARLKVGAKSAPTTPPYMPSIAEIIAAKKAEQAARTPTGAIDVYHHAEAPAPMGSTTIESAKIAWAMHYDRWTTAPIEHINGNLDDVRLENLRLTLPD